MIEIAVCDDQKEIVNSMASMLERYAVERNEEIRVFKFYSGYDVLDDYKSHYDILFLDIKMPQISGIEVAEKIRMKDEKVTIIFLTSLLGRAVDGYKVKAANYIIKPMSYKRLEIELNNWRQEYHKKDDSYVIINNDNGQYKVFLKTISYIETYNRNLLVHREKDNIISYQKMKVVEKELEHFGFVRCHSSYMVNLLYVEQIEKMDILLISGDKIPISQTKRKRFMESLAEYWGKRL